MALKITDILTPMLKAAKKSLGEDWKKVSDYGEPEFKKLAQSLIDISKLTASGKVTVQQAKALMQIHRNTTMIVMLTVEGLGVIAVENAINSALKAAKTAVNTAAGVALL
jgi:hypothetical protein